MTELSKFLSFVLRHRPEAIGLTLDEQGWVEIERLIAACRAHGTEVSRVVLEQIIVESPKQRFAISSDRERVRANQGHSTQVDLGYQPKRPPDVLFHGTVSSNLDAIRSNGLKKMARHHVHLSPDVLTATVVGQRRGKPVVLTVRAGQMHHDGHLFYVSANGVWLTERVPPQYIELPDEKEANAR
jgi:putative RNA 2'-phosphotransferase